MNIIPAPKKGEVGKVKSLLKMGNLIPLKDSDYVEETLEKIDEWKKVPANRQLLSPRDDKAMFPFADSRPSSPEEFNKILGSVFRYDGYDYDLTTRDFVTVDDKGEVIGYFHCIIAELAGGITSVTGLRTYRFGGTPYRYGKAQRAFYDWLNETFDVISMLFCANGDFTKGAVGIESNEVMSETLKRVFEKRERECGFAQPGAFNNLLKRYKGVFTPYVSYVPDLNGDDRFLHIMRWRGKPGVAKGLAPLRVDDLVRNEETLSKLKEHGITDYL